MYALFLLGNKGARRARAFVLIGNVARALCKNISLGGSLARKKVCWGKRGK